MVQQKMTSKRLFLISTNQFLEETFSSEVEAGGRGEET
jgi:hypothetical protein